MYIPPAFREDDPAILLRLMRDTRLSTLVTATAAGPIGTPLPLFFDPDEGEHGTLYGHLARANPQWQAEPIGDAMAIFMGADAYVSPSWYAAKREHHKVVPTWNYEAVHAYGPVEFFEDPVRLLEAVTRLTNLREGAMATPWQVADAPPAFVQAQLRGIVGVRLAIRRLEGKRKLSQNRPAADRDGVARALADSPDPADRRVASLIPLDPI